MVKVEKAATRTRPLQKLIITAMALQKKLHQQQACYLIRWITRGTQFSPDLMQVDDGAESSKRRSTAVQYCLQPLVQKLAGDHGSERKPVVIMRAVVIVEG
jgi:hypothetical protein